jgi:hypothetical protein
VPNLACPIPVIGTGFEQILTGVVGQGHASQFYFTV